MSYREDKFKLLCLIAGFNDLQITKVLEYAENVDKGYKQRCGYCSDCHEPTQACICDK